ncbi:replication initiation protein RepM [Moraxella sp. CTOTU49803]|uniref:replication initiation protein RepM n=1 Tax=Moraxella sp. CTOTU49803 TaxID=2953840 RepID=UPI0028ABE213|nr:replication initiation protein RepM [Moraxella sp. CTOTU49803]
MSKSDLVVKANRLNMALQYLTLPELRIIQLAIVDARETGKGLSTDTPLTIDAKRYANVFNTSRQNGYILMKQAEDTLFNRRFSFYDEEDKLVKSRWIQFIRYLDDEGAIELAFTYHVVKAISRIDGFEEFFTSYLLEQTAQLKSVYSVRLYELLVQWKSAGKTPVIELELIRGQIGLLNNEYTRMCDFKRRVLDLAVNEINEKTDLKVNYTQEKKGRIITGFKFSVKLKNNAKKDSQIDSKSDLNTIDWVNGKTDKESQDNIVKKTLTDKQLARIVHSKKFIADYGSMVSSSSPFNQSSDAWVAHMVEQLKRNPERFKKRSMHEYLDDEQAKRF